MERGNAMEYSDLNFNDDEKKRIINNKKAIVSWIMNNVVLNIRDDDVIRIDYGGTYISPRGFSKPVNNYHIAVYGREQNFRNGGGKNTSGYIGIGEKYGMISESLENCTCAWDIYPIMDNWQLIKSELLYKVEELKKSKAAIYEFEV